MPPSLPEVIGKYTIERFIESGGMGDVYLARDPALDRPVAIKFLREGFDNQEMRERFEREARAAGRLSHPNIVTIYEFGIFESRPFIAMEFVRGEPLSKLIRRREPMPLVRKLELMEGLCSGLAHAHKTGMVHRDIKPANLMVDNDGAPLKILDFGIVRMAGSGLTSHGVLVGTINYMSPEQITGRGTIDLRSDVFAVGAVLHEIFTYQRAFPGEMTDVLYKIVHTQPESAAVLTPGLDPGIVRAIDQCLEKAAERRYQDLAVLRRDLGRIRQRLEMEEQDSYGHTALTMRQPKDSSSHASRPSGAHRTPGSGAPVSGTPAPSTPPSAPSAPGSAPSARSAGPTPASDRARRAAEAAADLARAQRASEEARLELDREAEDQARLDAERLEQERQERDRLEQERQTRQRAQAEQARLAREQADQVKAEQARAEQARAEQARQAHARQEQQRLDKARAEEAERARVERERHEQVRLEEARQAREQADSDRAEAQKKAQHDRAEAQRKAEADAKRQAEARREQRSRDLAQAQKDVSAGRFLEAVQRLQPWQAESAGDAAFAPLLKQAEAGAAKIEAERREQEALARQVASANELVVRQDFAGASKVVQAILQAHPNHPAAKTLERDIARGVELRAKAATAVERARALFDAQPGEAMEVLERFTPAHGLVDSALAEMRERHAARERDRLRREQQERRQAQIAALTGRAGAIVRNRAVQAGAAALLVLVVVIASWSSIFPPTPIEPGANPGTAPVTPIGSSTVPTPPGGGATGGDKVVPPTGNGGVDPAIASPPDGNGQKPIAPVDPGNSTPPPSTVRPSGPITPVTPTGTSPGTPGPRTTPPTPGGTQGSNPTGRQPSVSERSGGPIVAVPPSNGTPAPTTPAPGTGRNDTRPAEPAEPPRETKANAPPPGVDHVELAQREINGWM
ncbi:MAG: protein kinase, partial [Vicinamibacteraceae bacterium]